MQDSGAKGFGIGTENVLKDKQQGGQQVRRHARQELQSIPLLAVANGKYSRLAVCSSRCLFAAVPAMHITTDWCHALPSMR